MPRVQSPSLQDKVWNTTASSWRKLLLEIPLDGRSFDDRYGVGRRDQVLAEATKWCLEFRQQDHEFQTKNIYIFGFLTAFLLTIAGLKESEIRRSGGELAGMLTSTRDHPVAPQGHECDQVCGTLIRDHAVQCALRALYQPMPGRNSGGSGGIALANSEWKNLDFDSLTFHCHGTTSIILRGKAADPTHGTRDLFALKLVLYPFLRISTVEVSTRQYMSVYSQADGQRSHIVRVWASTSQWILMDFIEGIALDDLLANEYLISAKLDDSSRTFTEILANLIRDLPDGGATRVGIADADLANTPVNELLRLYNSTVETNGEVRISETRSKVKFEHMEILGAALFDALDDLESKGITHEDLAPQNIIVSDDPEWSFKLVDLGRNYLYTHAVTGSLSLEASYIAPEVRKGDLNTPKADLYSLGQILIELGGIRHNWDGRVPDEFYVRGPLLARFLEDLIDHDPGRRLGIFTPRPGSAVYRDLRISFREELAAADAAEKYELPWSTRPDPISLIREMFRPLADAPGRQRRLWKIRRQQHLSKDPVRGMHVSWLLFWSTLAAGAFTLAMTVVVMWLLRDLGWSWQDRLIEAIQKVTGGEKKDVLPFVDNLRAPGYVIPDWRANLPERIVGISYVMLGARYYEALLAGVSPAFSYFRRDSLGLKAIVAEFFMRLETIVAMGLVVSVTLIDARWWLIASALGQTIAVACNWTVAQFAKSAVDAAWRNSVTTIQHPDDVTGLREFMRWTPANVCYCIVLWLVGALLYYHIIHDTYVYATLVALLNLFLFYMIKCGLRAPEVRIALTKACFSAERLRLVRR